MYKVVRTKKVVKIGNTCLSDAFYKSCIKVLSNSGNTEFNYKKNIYELVDSHLRSLGICNPSVHLGKGIQTAKTYVNRAIKDKYVRLSNVTEE